MKENVKGTTQTVTLTISDGTVINNVPWTQGMNVQSVLEAAYNLSVNPPTPSPLSYWIEYYGTINSVYLGYAVTMMDGTSQQGNYYWFLYINNVTATTGIDNTTVNAGDQILFKYEAYSAQLHANTPARWIREMKMG